MPFPPPPADGTQALASLPVRSQIVLSFLACGNEPQFFDNGNTSVGEGAISFVIAKLVWSSTRPNFDGSRQQGAICKGEGSFSITDIKSWLPDDTFWNKHPNQPSGDMPILSSADLAMLSGDFAATALKRFGCSIAAGNDPSPDFAATFATQPVDPNAPNGPYLLHGQFSVSQRCMQFEINNLVPQWTVSGSAGSSGLPCVDQFSSPSGEWDVSVRDLTRLYYLDAAYGSVLDQPSHDHIRDDLLTLDRSPGPDAYSVLQCGNTGDRHTGSPDQRADDNSFGNNALQTIGDSAGWLLNRLLVLVAAEAPVLNALSAFAAVAAPELLPVLPLLASIGIEGASTSVISETENHHLMMESSRYLNNYVIANLLAVGRPGAAAQYQFYAAQGKEWLLKRMQDVLANDFIEYNARPYQRYSLISIYNLFDFAPDPEVRTMAGMVLEYADLKFAISGNQSRRVVPFRRRQETLDEVTSITDSAAADDFQVSQMLFLANQSQQLWPAPAPLLIGPPPPPDRLMSREGVKEMIYLATSKYRPDAQILDLAIHKPRSYYQQLAHRGAIEIYSGTPGYVISAGGFETDAAYTVTIDGITGGAQVDHGAGVPTSLLLAAGIGDTDHGSFIRFDGVKEDHGSAGSDDFKNAHNVSFNHNTCVWNGFACGTNLVVPSAMISPGCQPIRSVLAYWSFLDTTSCDPSAPKVYVAIYGQKCQDDDQHCKTAETGPAFPNQGFFEAIYNPVDDFSTFQTKTIAANPKPFDGLASTGTYHSYSGHTIAFDTEAHQRDTSNWGVRSIDSAPQPDLRTWPPAQGDIIHATGDGHILVTFPATGNKIQYDYSNWAAPVRTP